EALEVCHERLLGDPECDLLYTDEDRVDLEGEALGRFLKPDWSPERLRCQQYVNHLSVYRRALVDEIGGVRAGFDGSQDYDLVLRATEAARRIVHVPEVLYHWRVGPGQGSSTPNPAVCEAASRAIKEHCDRIGVEARVEQIDPVGVFRLHRALRQEPLVSIVIPTRGSIGKLGGEVAPFVTSAVRSIVERSTYAHLEFVVVADTVTPAEVVAELYELLADRLTLVPYDRPFNFSHKIDLGVAAAKGPYVLLLNDDIEVITPDWIETMLGIGQQADVGMVGATLLLEDDTLQHAGHLYLGETVIQHVAYGQDYRSPGPDMALVADRECSGVTAACALMTRSVFFEVGGLSRLFPVNFNDVDLSLKLRSLGYRIVVTPHARLHHYESKSRRVGVGPSEVALIRSRWGRILREGDPYWRYP
ncbi:MAG: glycosyltransferase, partial [Acidimicrobiaceae bacterium]|nr:glycosyltransferase [Acidimicrobiaceae bacterium]